VSDDVVVMNSGHVIERGLPQSIYTYPQNEFTARFLGVSNSLDGTVTGLAGKAATIELASHTLICPNSGQVGVGDRVSVFMRPESFRLSRRRHSDDAWPGEIEFSIYHGDCWDYHVRVGTEVLKVRVYREKVGLSHGDAVFLEPDCESMIVMGTDGATSEPADRDAVHRSLSEVT
jgi:iron(III) transport system ATP-binding protein